MLILGTAPRVALSVARSLARRGIEVIAAPSSDDERRIPSAAIVAYVPLPDARACPDEFDTGLLRAVERTGVDLLLPCSDKALAAVARVYDRIRPLCDPGSPPPDVVRRVLEKPATLDAARALGIDVPASYDLAAGSLPETLAYPLVAKPKNHAGLGGYRIRHFADASSLEEAMQDDPQFADRYLLQQFVPGAGVGVAVLMHAGAPLAVFAHRRLKELPAAGGVSVVSESIAPERGLVGKAVARLRALSWEGVALVEFRREPSGTPWLMEINGRYWGSLPTAIAAGVDFPYYHWQVAHGMMPSVVAPYATGVRVRWTRGDLLRLRERLFERPGFGTPRARAADELRSFASDFAPTVRSAMWDWRDPLPAIVDVFPALGRFFASALRAAGKALLPRGVVRAYRRFGFSGVRDYLRLRRALLPRPFRPRSVLFVCSGNIMRSALAAAVFDATLRERGVNGVAVASSGLHALTGKPADPRAVGAAAALGLDLRAHRSTPMSEALAAAHDAIFAMDRLQEIELLRRFPAWEKRMYALGSSNPDLPSVEIPDPYLAEAAQCTKILRLVRERAADLARIVARDFSPRASEGGGTDAKGATEPGAS